MPHYQTIDNETAHVVSSQLLKDISEYVGVRLGLNYPRERWTDLERAVKAIASESGFDDMETALRRMLSSPLTQKHIEIFSSHLTVGETYFFRETDSFNALERDIIPEFIDLRKHDRRLRIWCAGCSTGEEPYSIAILLSRIIPDLKNWNILILATDVNPRSLQKAAAGEYGEWSFRETPSWVKEKYFEKTDKARYKVHEHIKNMATFAHLNLAEDTYPSLINNTNAMDIIFCRNALMYLVPAVAKKCVQRFHDALLPDGWFLVSASEGHFLSDAEFTAINFPNTILYRKFGAKQLRSTYHYEFPDIFPASFSDVFFAELPGAKQDIPVFDETFSQGAAEAGPEPAAGEPVQDVYAEALSLYEKGRYRESTERMLAALSENQNKAKAMLLLARAFANSGELSKAEEWCRKAIENDRTNPVYCYLLANILQEMGQFDNAFNLLKTVIYLDNEFVLAHFALGNLSRQKGMTKESSRHFRNSLSLLKSYKPSDMIPESEGLTALRLTEMINSIIGMESVT
ncbi:MAG: chemotaxis protein CheR [Syntrophus sp. (in: bacteria)]|nr:chemotaxis protein CheR [Syntrophus sp. (in: bacteria)]